MSSLIVEARGVLDQARRALPDHRDELDAARDRLDGPLRVAIAGRVKAGKSTLLNALVREELAPTDAGECTKIVTWYQGGRHKQVTLVPRDGRPTTVRWRRDGGAVDVELAEWHPDQIDHLEIEWPSPELSQVTLVDTPGLASARRHVSARATGFLTNGDGGPGQADAVVYLLRHLHPEDLAFFEAFSDVLTGDSAALNATGVLSRADEVGGAGLDALDAASATVDRYLADPRLRERLRVVVPVAGLLAMASVALTEADMRAFRILAAAPLRVARRALLSAGGFLVDETLSLPAPDRERLLDRYGLYGLRYAVEQMRPRDRSAAELAGLLADQSGIGALRELLRTQFGARAQVLKARSALATVKALAEATPSTEARHLTDRIHDVELSAHEFVEIRMLQVLQTKPALAAALDVRAAARVLGGDGPAAWQRLDIAPGSSDDDIETVARDEIERWRAAVHQDDFGGRDRRDVAEAVVRSLEGIVDEVARPG